MKPRAKGKRKRVVARVDGVAITQKQADALEGFFFDQRREVAAVAERCSRAETQLKGDEARIATLSDRLAALERPPRWCRLLLRWP